MKVTVIGSGGSIPDAHRGSPCFLLESNRKKFLIDLGPGSLRQLALIGVDVNDINQIFLTHIHPDHSLELVNFLFVSKCGGGAKFSIESQQKKMPQPRTDDLVIFAGKGFNKFISSLFDAYGDWIIPTNFKFIIKEVQNEIFYIDNLRVICQKTTHSENSVAYRFEKQTSADENKIDTKSVVFCGDSDYDDSLVKICMNAYIVLVECTTSDDKQIVGHMSPEKVKKLIKLANLKNVCLVHTYPFWTTYDVKKIFSDEPAKISVAEDFDTFEL